MSLMRGGEYEVATLEVLRLIKESRCSAFTAKFIYANVMYITK